MSCDTMAKTMNEPPILPDDSQYNQPTSAPNEFENPYAPTTAAPTAQTAQSLDLPPTYWVVLIAAFGGFAILSYVATGLGVPAIFALISAAIRVPLLQRRLPTMSTIDRPNPLVMLLTSWGFSLVIGAASLVAFCVICVPMGFLALAADGKGNAIPIVIGLSGFITLFVYVLLFRMSLKMHI